MDVMRIFMNGLLNRRRTALFQDRSRCVKPYKSQGINSKDIGMARPIQAIDLEGLVPGDSISSVPEIRWVDPSKLLINDKYQREVSRRGVKMISKIVAEFDWARYKLPNVVETVEGLEVIDGQHTAIACASHPDIKSIPIAIISAATLGEQAQAFLGINRDRMAVNHMQMHHASVASGSDEAVAVNALCEKADVTILRSMKGPRNYKEGETVAVKQIGDLLRYGEDHALRVLAICRNAKLAPIGAAYVRAISTILLDPERMSIIDEATLQVTVQKTRASIDKDVRAWTNEYDKPYFEGLASCLFKAAKNHTPTSTGRRGQSAIAAE